jgi:hypothetical protein
LHGKWAFFYVEPVTIHPSNSVLGRPPPHLPVGGPRRKIRLITEADNMGRIMVTDDGFVCFFLEDDHQVIKFLNTVFASARLLCGVIGYIVRLGELCNFDWVPGNQYIDIMGYALIERNVISFQRDGDNQTFDRPRKLVTPRKMKQTINFANSVLSNKDIHIDLILLFDGFTLHYKEAHTAAYLYGWMMIETFLGKIWNEYVDSMNRSSKDKVSLKEHRTWTTHHHIEMLSAVNKMDDKTRNLLHKLRQKRNSIIHDRKDIGEKEAYNCLLIADQILRNRFNNPNTPFVNVHDLSAL